MQAYSIKTNVLENVLNIFYGNRYYMIEEKLHSESVVRRCQTETIDVSSRNFN